MFDSHCHVHFREFDFDRKEVLERARSAGVEGMLLVGCDMETNQRAVEMAALDENMWATVGIHPHEAEKWSPQVKEKLISLIESNKKVVAIGETGLDFFRNLSPREVQIEVFLEQIRLAKQFDLPVIVHCREAFDQVFDLLMAENIRKVLFHCFTGDLEYATKLWQRGFYTSFSGIVTYPKNDYLREVVREAPTEQFLIETDCPYLPPQSFRGQRNEPAYLSETLTGIAQIRNLSFEQANSLISANSERFFRLN